MAEATPKTEVTEVKAFARGIHIAPRKVRLVATLIQKMPVAQALVQLNFINKKATLPIKKLVDSAVSNASHNFQIEADRLFIKSLTVDMGRVLFRYQPRAQGRAFPVRKRTSHLNLILGVLKAGKPSKRKAAASAKKTPPAEAEVKAMSAAERDDSPPAEKKSRFGWFRKKESGPSQVPPKQDPKGRHYTSFDRRGNM